VGENKKTRLKAYLRELPMVQLKRKSTDKKLQASEITDYKKVWYEIFQPMKLKISETAENQ
jgi:hypothetical protein